VTIDPSRDRRRNAELAIIMHGTSRPREHAARLLARLVLESGGRGAAYGPVDDLHANLVVPVSAITTDREMKWDAALPRTFVRTVGRDRGTPWRLMVRGVDPDRLRGLEPLAAFAAGALRAAGFRWRPPIPLPATEGPYAQFLAALDAYRVVASTSSGTSRAGPLRRELQRTVVRGGWEAARAVINTLRDLERLPAALFDLGHRLEEAGSLAEATAVYVILYEVALLNVDSALGIDAARSAGRASRKAADWPEAMRWYGLARRIAEHEGDFLRLVRSLDGLGNAHRERGAFPKARQCYHDAWKVAQVVRDPIETANVALGLMTVEREAGRLEAAASYAWTALGLQSDPAERANLLLNIGTLLRDGGDLEAAECAYRVAGTSGRTADVALMAKDALAYCAALQGDVHAYERLRPRAPHAAPYLRVQVGYFRGAALHALGDDRAPRVLAAVERYAKAHGLAEWEIKAARLQEHSLPTSRRVVETPAHVRQGLKDLEAALV
jgi:tetratricopeptide (TPR) repeat protein